MILGELGHEVAGRIDHRRPQHPDLDVQYGPRHTVSLTPDGQFREIFGREEIEAIGRWAAEHGIALVVPDTSPRGDGVPDHEDYDLGQGAGFYVNATQDPWAQHFQMWDYITDELPRALFSRFAVDEARQGITGHSMGGHGALTIAMSFPDRFASVSAFAPICNPMDSDWGRKQFTAYLGENTALWEPHDATVLMRETGFPGPVLIDTGTTDQFGDLLKTEALAEAIAQRRQPATLRLQPGYDHSYFFVSSFMEDHVAFHAEALYGVDG